MKRSNHTAAQFGATRPSTFLQMMVICAGLALLLCAPAIAGDKADKEALIDCISGTFNSLEPDDQKNEVYPGHKLTWYVYGKKYTSVKIVFVKKSDACKGESPFPALEFSEVIQKEYGFKKIDSDKAKTTSAESCYSYTITCKPPSGSEKIIDPIIDVPKP